MPPVANVNVCRECGRPLRLSQRKVKTDHSAAMRLDRDVRTVLPRMTFPTTAGDMGRLMWAMDRHWSEAESVLMRLERGGYITRIEPKWKGKKMIRQWALGCTAPLPKEGKHG